MKAQTIAIRLRNPYGEKVNALVQVNKDSLCPIAQAFYNYTASQDKPHSWELAGEGQW